MFHKILTAFFFCSILNVFNLKCYSTEVSDLHIDSGSRADFTLQDLLEGRGSDIIIKLRAKRVLFLGDMPDNAEPSLAETYAELLREEEIEIYKSDLVCEDKDYCPEKNIFERHVDHQNTLPFQDNFFDLIIGKRILCQCNKWMMDKTCGGLILSDTERLTNFFCEVARVLNKENPYSISILHGYDFHYLRKIPNISNQVFHDACTHIASQPLSKKPLYAQVVYVDEFHDFCLEESNITSQRICVFIGNISLKEMSEK